MNNNIPVNHFEEEELTQETENLIELAESCGLDFTGDFDEGEPEFMGTSKQFEAFEDERDKYYKGFGYEKFKEMREEQLDSEKRDAEIMEAIDIIGEQYDDAKAAYEAGEIEGTDKHPAYGRETIINIEKLEIKL